MNLWLEIEGNETALISGSVGLDSWDDILMTNLGRHGSRILVRGAQQSFDPKGGPEAKICSKLGFSP